MLEPESGDALNDGSGWTLNQDCSIYRRQSDSELLKSGTEGWVLGTPLGFRVEISGVSPDRPSTIDHEILSCHEFRCIRTEELDCRLVFVTVGHSS